MGFRQSASRFIAPAKAIEGQLLRPHERRHGRGSAFKHHAAEGITLFGVLVSVLCLRSLLQIVLYLFFNSLFRATRRPQQRVRLSVHLDRLMG